jgi:hypothetical protein
VGALRIPSSTSKQDSSQSRSFRPLPHRPEQRGTEARAKRRESYREEGISRMAATRCPSEFEGQRVGDDLEDETSRQPGQANDGASAILGDLGNHCTVPAENRARTLKRLLGRNRDQA